MARDQKLEIWHNQTASLVSIFKLDHRGVQTDVLVNAGRRINLTPEERELNEAMCASEELNPFRNGLLVAIKLTDDPDATPVEKTSNMSSDKELADLLKKSGTVFNKALREITSEVTLRRLEALATANDATIKQVETIREYLEEVSPAPKVQINEIVPPTN